MMASAYAHATGGRVGKTDLQRYCDNIFPPWQHGENNDAVNKRHEFTMPGVGSLADFHGDVSNPALVLYGNSYFAMVPLVRAFEEAHPDYAGRIFYVTVPLGMLETAFKAGGTFTSGNMTSTTKPDAYFAGLKNAPVRHLRLGGARPAHMPVSIAGHPARALKHHRLRRWHRPRAHQVAWRGWSSAA